MMYLKVGIIFTLAILAIYFFFNRTADRDTQVFSIVRRRLAQSPLNIRTFFCLTWMILCLAAVWPRTLYRLYRRDDRLLD
jgi:hypothetical protein